MATARRIYDAVTDDAMPADDLSEGVRDAVPSNFLKILTSNLATKLGDALASPKTTLAWLATALGMPAFVLALLVPIRESGSMLPQLFLRSYLRQKQIRKWTWVGGSVVQGATIGGLGIVAATLTGTEAGLATLALIALFSLARSACSLASKDVLGKTIPSNKRGQLTGLATSGSGMLTLLVAGMLLAMRNDAPDTIALAAFLAGAGALWWLAALVYASIHEPPGPDEDAGNGQATFAGLRLLVSDAPFRRFVLARALLMGSALSAPFYVALAQRELGSAFWVLGAFIGGTGIASLVSGPVWGRLADRSARLVMAAAGVLAAAAGAATVAGYVLGRNGLSADPWFLPSMYFVLSLAHAGVRVGRKTYVVNLGEGNRRTDYVAVGNTVIGVLLLAVGSLGALAPVIGQTGVLLVLAGMSLAGAIFSLLLKPT